MKTSTLASAAALLISSYAATVTLETTPCIDPSYPLEQFEIELNPSTAVPKYLPTVCGLRILSASSGVDINSIQCRAFRDTAGTQPGSAVFTYANPALIATNPIQEQSILCTYPTTGNIRRQDNGTASASSGVAVSSITATLPASSSPAARSTVTSIQVVTASTRAPSPSGNLTTPSTTLRPSASQTTGPPRETTGAASSVGVGVGVAFAAFLAVLL